MGRKYRFIAVEGEGEHFQPLLSLCDLELDASRPTRVLRANEHPIPDDALMWIRHARGTLFDFRTLGLRFTDYVAAITELAQVTKSRVMCTEDLSTVIYDVIIVVGATGELIRHVVHTEVGECVSVGAPLFDAGQPRWGGPDEFDYPEYTPALALEWFLGFSAYDWSDLRLSEATPSEMFATPVREVR
jgi:hypothetical protein